MGGKALQKTARSLIVLALLLLVVSPTVLAQQETPTPGSEYYRVETRVLDDGTSIDQVVINGPPTPPIGFERPTAPGYVEAAATLPVPAYNWSFGCSATSASMIAAYYDRTLYPDMYTGPTNGGVMPMDNSVWGDWWDGHDWRHQCPLSATRNGLDGRTTRGHVDDYWIYYGQPGPDPYVTNGWTEHILGDCTGDFMKTSKWFSEYGFNTDGGTTFYYYTSGAPTPAADLEGMGPPYSYDGGVGLKQFYESRGYTVVTAYNQYRLGYHGAAQGFTYDDYKAEIDAGRPVMIHLEGHTIVGVGYDDSSGDLMYIHDTWDYSTHTMTWGAPYSGMAHVGVTVVRLAGGYYRSVATGDWHSGSTWDTGTVPGANSAVTIGAGHTVTLDGDAECYDLVVESGGRWICRPTISP